MFSPFVLVNFSFVLLGRVLRPNLLYELSLTSCSMTNLLRKGRFSNHYRSSLISGGSLTFYIYMKKNFFFLGIFASFCKKILFF